MVRRNAGFIGTDGINAPDAPSVDSVTLSDHGQVSVAFTAPTDTGTSAITGFVATTNDGIGATGSSSPITITGLTNGTSYTARVYAANAFGTSAASVASASFTPVADSTRLLRFGGRLYGGSGNDIVDIRFVTIETLGNEADFGDLTGGRSSFGALSNATRSVTGGGYTGSANTNAMDYVNPTSAGNASDFGDLTATRNLTAGLANDTRGVFAGGSGPLNVIEYITIGSTGNATDFGDLTQGREIMNAGASSSTRGMFFGGNT